MFSGLNAAGIRLQLRVAATREKLARELADESRRLCAAAATLAAADDDEDVAGGRPGVRRGVEQLDADTGEVLRRWPTQSAAVRGLGLLHHSSPLAVHCRGASPNI